ncbi:MAG: PAS domain-containing sensor histidine kinase [Gammaproteobacteria bacterium]|nr:PAS domain-containing sensor histidine kinase [Gammaproteobacteria bacterium]
MRHVKNVKRPKILDELQRISQILPVPIYWLDVNSVAIGGNEAVFKAIGASQDAIGKTPYDFYPFELADNIVRHNEEVIRTGKILTQEEPIKDMITGEIKYFTAIKAPLRDDDGNIIGIVGTSIDITAEKDAERLKIENESHKNSLQEQEKFKNIAEQVAHDIRSPLASLLMIVKACTEIPEAERVALREAAINIGDIANNLLNQYTPKDADSASEFEDRQPILISATLLQLLADKKYQYHDLPIKFDHDFSQYGNFAFIKIEPSSFKRMVSNLINNSVDAIEKNSGSIMLKLETSKEWVKVIITDNGKGMMPELISKIMNNITVTEGKEGGHGLGLTQVRETLVRNQGELSFYSSVGKGTEVTIKFPRITAPDWIAEEIKLGNNDLVIILDDGTSIHRAWDSHFESIVKKNPDIRLKHFERGNEALAFIMNLSPTEKKKVFLLTDYELLKQELNGLNVIEQGKINRSILVTSHYANQTVREHATRTGTKILPKQLASEISINIDASMDYEDLLDSRLSNKKVDLVLVDDDKTFAQNLILFAFRNKVADHYTNPSHFLKNLSSYPKETRIFLDNNFAIADITGIELAKQLHEQGYSQLYLLTGDTFSNGDLPDYLTVIRKDDINSIKNL